MHNRWTWLLAAGAGSAWLAAAPQALALTSEQRFDRLERHIMELERRLEASEAENARLRSQAPSPATAGKAAPTNAAAPDVKALDQKVKLLERKLEVDKEAAEAARKTQPKLEAGPDTGFRITSANGENQLRLRGFVQLDGDFFVEDEDTSAAGVGINNITGEPNPIQPGNGLGLDRFVVRRARLQTAGTLFKYAGTLRLKWNSTPIPAS